MLKSTVVMLMVSLMCVCAVSAQEDVVPYTINFQGALKHKNAFSLEEPLTGVQQVQFRIWDDPEGGTLIWGRQFPVFCNSNGVFNILLGDNGTKLGGTKAKLSEVFANPARYLELTVDGHGGAIRPRQQIVSVGYAISAQDAAMIDAASGDFEVSGALTLMVTNTSDEAASFDGGTLYQEPAVRVSGESGDVVMMASTNYYSFEGTATLFVPGAAQSNRVHLLGESKRMQTEDFDWAVTAWLQKNCFALFLNHGDIKAGIKNISESFVVDLSGEGIGAVLLPVPGTSFDWWATWGDDCDYGYQCFWMGDAGEHQ